MIQTTCYEIIFDDFESMLLQKLPLPSFTPYIQLLDYSMLLKAKHDKLIHKSIQSLA